MLLSVFILHLQFRLFCQFVCPTAQPQREVEWDRERGRKRAVEASACLQLSDTHFPFSICHFALSVFHLCSALVVVFLLLVFSPPFRFLRPSCGFNMEITSSPASGHTAGTTDRQGDGTMSSGRNPWQSINKSGKQATTLAATATTTATATARATCIKACACRCMFVYVCAWFSYLLLGFNSQFKIRHMPQKNSAQLINTNSNNNNKNNNISNMGFCSNNTRIYSDSSNSCCCRCRCSYSTQLAAAVEARFMTPVQLLAVDGVSQQQCAE